MRVARAWSVALMGMDATRVEVEVALTSGLPKTILVGLPDAALHDARERCCAAMIASGTRWPAGRVTINLSPATLPKAGSHYDLSIVAAVGAAAGACHPDALGAVALFGEVGLDGRVRAVRGLLPAVLGASQEGLHSVVVPAEQLREAELVQGVSARGVASVGELFDVLRGGPGSRPPAGPVTEPAQEEPKDLRDVAGQVEARWALEVAAAGRHHLFLHGPPGVGKTLLAERLPGILPDLELSESLEVSAIHSLTGLRLDGLITRPPYADPHHTASMASLVGGGTRIAVPGAISRAHLGVLFLDEAPEFQPKVMDALRVPLESGRIVLGRSMATATYPARFQLVLAANPCPCGHYGTPGARCTCTPADVRRYAQKVSGPILDRIDIHQHLRPLRRSLLADALRSAESSEVVAGRVLLARQRQRARLEPLGWRTNGEIPGPVLRRGLPLPDGVDLLEDAVSQGRLSARGVDKVLRLSWTLADLAGAARPDSRHLRTALALRRGEGDLDRGSHGRA